MKKFFLSFLFLASSFGLDAAGTYVPAAGPVQLGDAMGVPGATRGAIMQAIIAHNPANPQSNPILASANIAIENFDGQGQNFRSYQTIVFRIGQSVNAQLAIEAVKAFERVIMHLYDYDVYMVGGYKPGLSIILPSGIRWSWIRPWNYFSPKSYFSDNDARCKQLIDELDKLADVVKIHSIPEYVRLKATVQSYRNWRRNVMLTVAAYLAADMYKHGYDDSIVNEFYQGGLSNSGEIAINHMMNLGSGLRHVGAGLKIGVHGLWNYGIAPAGKFIFGGAAAFKKNDKKELPKEPGVKPEVKVDKALKGKINDHQQEMQDFENARFNAAVEESLKQDVDEQNLSNKGLASVSKAMPVQKQSMPVWSSLCQIVKTEKELREERKKLTFDKIEQAKQATLGKVLQWQEERKKKIGVVDHLETANVKNNPKFVEKSKSLVEPLKPKVQEVQVKVSNGLQEIGPSISKKIESAENVKSESAKDAFKEKLLSSCLERVKQQYEADQQKKDNFLNGCKSYWNQFKNNMILSDAQRQKLNRASEYFRKGKANEF